MWPVSALWAPALTGSHAITLRVEVWRGGQRLASTTDGSLLVSGGTVTATARNRVRRTATLTVPETFYPTSPADLLTPYGTEIRIWRGIDYGSTTETPPVFRGRIDSIDDHSRNDGVAEISCSDPGADLNDARFETPRAALAGITTTAEIAGLIAETGAAVVNQATRNGTIGPGLAWDRDRGQAVDDLATSIGVDVWAGPDGTWWITDPPTLDQPAVWTLTDGANGTIVSDQRTVSRVGVYSVVVVILEKADGSTPSQVVVADLDPTSPTYVNGPFGRVPRFYRSPLVANDTQARIAGQALLTRSVALTRSRQITCVPNPALEVGDRIDLTVAGVTEPHIIDSFTLPLGVDNPAMSIVTRLATPEAGDQEN